MENLTEEIWKVVPLCLMWSSWRERNLHTFEGKSIGGTAQGYMSGLATSQLYFLFL